MAMEGYSIFSKSPSLAINWFKVISRGLVGRVYPFAEIPSVYSIKPEPTGLRERDRETETERERTQRERERERKRERELETERERERERERGVKVLG